MASIKFGLSLVWLKNNENRDDIPKESEVGMPWKMAESGGIETQDGNPVFVYPDGREGPLNGDSTLIQIGELKNEAKTHRQKYSDLKKKVQPFLDADDIDLENPGVYLNQAREAMKLVKEYKEKGNPSAEDIERVKQGVAELFEGRIKEKDKAHQREIEKLNQALNSGKNQLHRMLVKSHFEQSEFLREKTHVIPEMAYNTFGKNFIVEERENEDPVTYAVDASGEKIFSMNGSKYADPQEAIEILVRSHPQRDKMLKTTSGGSGAQGGARDKAFVGKTIVASDMEAASRNIEKIARGEVIVVPR